VTDVMHGGRAPSRRRWLPLVIVGAVVAAVGVVGSLLIGLNLLYTLPLLLVLAGGTYLLHRWRNRRRDTPRRAGIGTVLAETAVAAGALFVLLQVVPFGRMPSNPPVTGEPAWNSPRTRALAVRACFDCHSNETEEPWYANVAPISWAVSDHVESGRSKLNFSEFDTEQEDADKAADTTEDGDMPPGYYTRFGLHSSAKLSDAELTELIAGLRATPGLSDD
jgi:hypothetical protein